MTLELRGNKLITDMPGKTHWSSLQEHEKGGGLCLWFAKPLAK